MPRRITAALAGLAAAAGVALTGIAPASADSFMDPPPSGDGQPLVNHGWEQVCTYGGSGDVIVRTKGYLTYQKGTPHIWITTKGIQFFNQRNDGAISTTNMYHYRGVDVPSNNNSNGNVVAQGWKTQAWWYDTSHPGTDMYGWDYHTSQAVDHSQDSEFIRVRYYLPNRTTSGCQLNITPTNYKF